MIRAVAFDLEGPVIDVEFAHHGAHISAAADVGVKLSIEECFEKIPHFIGGPDEKIAEEIAGLAGGGADPKFIFQRDSLHYERILKEAEIKPRPGFVEFLEWLIAKKVKVSIGSAVDREHGDMFLRKTGLSRYFSPELVLMAGDVVNSKPAPDVYLETARRMRVGVKEQLVFEDSPRGAMAAVVAGSPVVGMPIYNKPKVISRLKEAGANPIFLDWRQIDPEKLIYKFELDPSDQLAGRKVIES